MSNKRKNWQQYTSWEFFKETKDMEGVLFSPRIEWLVSTTVPYSLFWFSGGLSLCLVNSHSTSLAHALYLLLRSSTVAVCSSSLNLLLNWKLLGDRKITLHIFLSSATYIIGGNLKIRKERKFLEHVLCIRQMQGVIWKGTIINLCSLSSFCINWDLTLHTQM